MYNSTIDNENAYLPATKALEKARIKRRTKCVRRYAALPPGRTTKKLRTPPPQRVEGQDASAGDDDEFTNLFPSIEWVSSDDDCETTTTTTTKSRGATAPHNQLKVVTSSNGQVVRERTRSMSFLINQIKRKQQQQKHQPLRRHPFLKHRQEQQKQRQIRQQQQQQQQQPDRHHHHGMVRSKAMVSKLSSLGSCYHHEPLDFINSELLILGCWGKIVTGSSMDAGCAVNDTKKLSIHHNGTTSGGPITAIKPRLKGTKQHPEIEL